MTTDPYDTKGVERVTLWRGSEQSDDPAAAEPVDLLAGASPPASVPGRAPTHSKRRPPSSVNCRNCPTSSNFPNRGIGADMIGRASALLVDLRFDATTRGYRLADRPGSISRKARDFVRVDLDAIEEAWETAGLVGSGRAIKIQSVGPLTLAAEVELPGGHRILTDRGALRDLVDSLAEGLALHAAEIGKRLGAKVVVQLDEPS